MLKLTIKNLKGETSTFDLVTQYHNEMYDKYQEAKIGVHPLGLKMEDMQKEESRIKLSSDSDIGQAVLRLIKPTDTLYDIYILDSSLTHVRDDIKEDLEQYIVNEQYDSQEELCEGIKEMTKELSSTKLSLYCPLVGKLNDHEGDYYEVDEYTLTANRYEIEKQLEKEQATEVRMAEYVGDHANLEDKLLFAEWNVEEINGTLYGRIDCYLTEALTDDETKRLKDAVTGQNSDGFGENFEQSEICIDEGSLYVSFWNCDGHYFLYTDDEMNAYLGQINGMKFGGWLMDYQFEHEMQMFFGESNLLSAETLFSGKTMVSKIGDNLRAKVEFISTHVSSEYDALKLSIINREQGLVDSKIFKFADIIGRKNDRNPHIWDSEGNARWHLYRPTAKEFEKIQGVVEGYIEMYADQELTERLGQKMGGM